MPARSIPPLIAFTLACLASTAHAHLDVKGPAFAGTNQEITFTIGHGCSGMDTLSLTLEIPESVTSLRTVSSTLGPPIITKNDADLISTITWAKPESEILDEDLAYYTIVVRMRIPNAPMTVLRFRATQTCMAPDGTLATAEWTASEDAGHGEGPGPAAALTILPPRVAGWNKYTVPVAVDDLATFFGDAQIVWRGDAAFSANTHTAELIDKTADVTALTSLAAGDEIWVKY